MRARYGARVDFLTLYIKEAHPTDEWQMPSNETEDVCYLQPRTTDERVAIARDFVERFHYDIPLLVDLIEDEANRLYAGWPERLYIVENGEILYKGGTGPFEFHPEEVEDWLAKRFPDAVTPSNATMR
jgi:type I thyroxine 5'-deiodinase